MTFVCSIYELCWIRSLPHKLAVGEVQFKVDSSNTDFPNMSDKPYTLKPRSDKDQNISGQLVVAFKSIKVLKAL